MAVRAIINEAAKFYFLLDSEKINEHDKAEYQKLLDDTMNEGMFGSSLKLLSGMLEKHYGTKLLIDGYDVPLAKAHANGLNNLKILTIADERFDEYFGFTDKEVRVLLEYYDVAAHYEEVKRWYDGYQFGNASVYCPWDVLNHCDRIRSGSHVQQENYWINTSSNDAVKRFIQESANATTRRELSAW